MWSSTSTETLTFKNKDVNLNEKNFVFLILHVSLFSLGIKWKFINTDGNQTHFGLFPGPAHVTQGGISTKNRVLCS